MSSFTFSQLTQPDLNQGYVGRYAPSPSGDLHLGNLLAAVVCYTQARRQNGHIFLRIEDTDHTRCKKIYTEHIIEDLHHFGFRFDAGPHFGQAPAHILQQKKHAKNIPDVIKKALKSYVQSERLPLYQAALDELLAQKKLYRCRCSRKDIQQAASAPHQGEENAVYPKTCRDKVISDGTAFALRVKVPDVSLCIQDAWAGNCCQSMIHDVGDFVLRRKDDVMAYHLAVVIDDALQGVTEVVRGRDLFTSSPQQVLLYQMLGFKAPSFAHGPLWVDESGQRLAKRRGELTLRAQLQKKRPADLLGQVGQVLGVCSPDEPILLDALLERLANKEDAFSMAKVATDNAQYGD